MAIILITEKKWGHIRVILGLYELAIMERKMETWTGLNAYTVPDLLIFGRSVGSQEGNVFFLMGHIYSTISPPSSSLAYSCSYEL